MHDEEKDQKIDLILAMVPAILDFVEEIRMDTLRLEDMRHGFVITDPVDQSALRT